MRARIAPHRMDRFVTKGEDMRFVEHGDALKEKMAEDQKRRAEVLKRRDAARGKSKE